MRRIILSLILMAGIAGFAGLLEGKDIPNVPVKSLVAPVAAPEIINWILDDPAISDGWEFSSSWIGEPDQFGTVSESKNLMVSTSEFHSGNSSLMLQINHKKKGYCGGMVTTSTQNNGTPASSWEEANKGKNISGCDTLEFWIKGTGNAKKKNIKIELVDASNISTFRINLIDFMQPGKDWQKVQIPLDEFFSGNKFDRRNLKSISFLVEQNDSPGEYTLYIDDMKLINTGISLKNRYKMVFEDNSVEDGVWNFSGVWSENGSKIETGLNQDDKNIPISLTEKYQGYSSLKFNVTQKKGGYAGAWFSGDLMGRGIPSDSWDNYNSAKDISPYNALQFYVKAKGKIFGRFELADTEKHSAAKIDLVKYLKTPDQWVKIVIPFKEINWMKMDKTKFKEFKFMIDSDVPAGNYVVFLDNLEFIEWPELK